MSDQSLRFFNENVLADANRASNEAIQNLLAKGGEEWAGIVAAPAGAGKTGFIAQAIGPMRRHRMRVAVGTPTNEQAFALVRRIAMAHPRETVTFVPASTVTLPQNVLKLPNVAQVAAAQANGASLVVGTLSKLGDALCRGTLMPFDILMIDESFQADSSRYYAVSGLAPTHLLVGDSGQLSPFSTMPDPYRWRGLAEDPLQTAVGVLLRNHGSCTPIHKLPVSHRLDTGAVRVARAFYPDLSFEAAVLPNVRRLKLLPATSSHRKTQLLDRVLDTSSQHGWAHVELPASPVLTTDPEMVELICALVRRLFSRGPLLKCERQNSWHELEQERVAVGVSHNDQKDLLRVELDALGFPNVVVETANKLQGLEFDIVIAWHPLAGIPDPDEFHLDPGRLCVLLTRHRHACIVLGRVSDRTLLESIPPSTPAYIGWDP